MASVSSGRVYAWETEYEKSWELLKEDAGGHVQRSINQILEKSKAAALKGATDGTSRHRLSMMRHLFIMIDLSDAMKNDSVGSSDYKPTLAIFTLRTIRRFVERFFDLNPIGQLGIIVTRNKRADKLTPLCGHPGKHLRALDELIAACSLLSGTASSVATVGDDETDDSLASASAMGPSGEASLQNALLLAARTLSKVPRHTSREVLAIFNSLSTCDPGDIHETIALCADSHITCSLVSLSAEVYIYRTLCSRTGGLFCVAIDGSHLQNILLEGAAATGGPNPGTVSQSKGDNNTTAPGYGNFLHPPPSATQTEATLVRVGFPRYRTHDASTGIDSQGNDPDPVPPVSACACHLDEEDQQQQNGGETAQSNRYPFTPSGYFCPVCRSKYCELPTECRVCDLTLVSAPHLARSYSHLFPPQEFELLDAGPETGQENTPEISCRACSFPIDHGSSVFKCKKCGFLFCIDCTLFVHSTLHTCPGCATYNHVSMDDGK